MTIYTGAGDATSETKQGRDNKILFYIILSIMEQPTLVPVGVNNGESIRVPTHRQFLDLIE